ncbi:MAG: mechanosensitive ion channel [Candidatus Rokubacteria bacterium]|nr:mechanosensitive ion channel [Candidatus Rokubacteria bacterium]
MGDFVRLESGVEGFVEDIGWRSTRVRVLPNNLVIVPNAKLAQSTITNYHLPEPDPRQRQLRIGSGPGGAGPGGGGERILRRFRAEGIEIPFPVRTVELRSRNAKVERS